MSSHLDAFKASLTARSRPTPGLVDWQHRHNQAITEWSPSRRPLSVRERNEAVVLNLAWSIWTLLRDSQWGTDGFVEPNVTVPLMQAYEHLLNVDLGRLDGGTCSSWVHTLAEAKGVEL